MDRIGEVFMKEKIKKFMIGYLPGFITGIIICGVASVIAATYFPSNQTIYDNTNTELKSENVQDAIDELYGVCFPKYGSDTITDLLPSNPDELYKDDHGDIRYYGANPNNYVSFNNELWRIIGVIDGKIKIVRNESIGSRVWASNQRNDWNNSDLKSYLNGEYYNSIDSTYKSMISEEKYYLGGPSASNDSFITLTASEYYDVERNGIVHPGNPASTEQYIGLMYTSDYGYAAGSSCLTTALYDYGNSCKNSDYLFSGVDEWLQDTEVDYGSAADCIFSSGYAGYNFAGGVVFGAKAVRPCLYLSSETIITSGYGSSTDPFQISI